MVTTKAPLKNNLENLESTSALLRIFLAFINSVPNFTVSVLQKHWFKSISLPFAFALGLIANLFTVINFIKLENKNLGNTSQLILSILICIFTLIAVVCFFVSCYPLAVGLCLLTAMALETIFNSSLFIYNLYKFIRTSASEQNKDLKATYAANCFKYGLATLFGTITLIAFILSVFFFPYLASGILIGIGIFSGIVVLVGGFYKLFNYFNDSMTSKQEISNVYSSAESISLVSEYERLIDNLASPVINKQDKNAYSFQYYKNENRHQHLSKDLAKNRAFLLMQIFEKINFLECEIEKNKGKLGERIWMQEEKRLEKIDLLIDLAIFLLPTNEKQSENILKVTEEKIPISVQNYKKIILQFQHFNNDNQDSNKNGKNYEDFYQFFNTYHSDKAFQSFFKNISDIKDLYDAVKHHFDIEKFLDLENVQKKIHIEKEKIQAGLKENDPEIIEKLENIQFTPYIYSEKFSEDY